MGRTFKLQEPGNTNPGLTAPFKCGEAGSSPVGIFRLLTGSVDVVRLSDDSVVKCRFNYLTRFPSRVRTTDKKLAHALFGEDVNVDDARAIMESFRRLYTNFFSKLSSEIEHCIYSYQKGQYVESFLYFYRALEKLAVAFPVMYVTAQADFERVHSMLKPLFSNEGDGELAFVNKFCGKLAQESDVLSEYNLEFAFDKTNAELHQVYFSEIKRVCSQKTVDKIESNDTYFTIPYKYSADLIIECRNRLFHNSNSGQKNFDIDRIGGAACLCRGLVDAGLHWLTLTYVEVVRSRAGQIRLN
jgi:hypothetical protein